MSLDKLHFCFLAFLPFTTHDELLDAAKTKLREAGLFNRFSKLKFELKSQTTKNWEDLSQFYENFIGKKVVCCYHPVKSDLDFDYKTSELLDYCFHLGNIQFEILSPTQKKALISNYTDVPHDFKKARRPKVLIVDPNDPEHLERKCQCGGTLVKNGNTWKCRQCTHRVEHPDAHKYPRLQNGICPKKRKNISIYVVFCCCLSPLLFIEGFFCCRILEIRL